MLTTHKCIFSIKKAPAGMLTAQKRFFLAKKCPCGHADSAKMHFSPKECPCGHVDTQSQIFFIKSVRKYYFSTSIKPQSGMILVYLGTIMPLLSYSLQWSWSRSWMGRKLLCFWRSCQWWRRPILGS